MKYTQEQLEAMSDFELSVIILKKESIDEGMEINIYSQRTTKLKCLSNSVSFLCDGEMCSVDYCNNPSDMMPLVFGRDLNLNVQHDNDGKYYSCTSGVDGEELGVNMVDHANPLRAAAIVWILIKQGEL